MPRVKTEPEPFCLVLGDTHTGSDTSPAPEAECKQPEQREMLAAYQLAVERAKKEARGKALVLMLGGDLVDGARHHGTWETWGTPDEQRDAAVALLRPLANGASAVYALKGTESHAGAKGGDDKSVARELGAATAKHVWRMVVGGKKLWWSHHGLRIPRDVNGAERALFTEAKRHYDLHKESLAALHEYETEPHAPEELRPALVELPDVVIHHHAHFSPRPVTAFRITVAVCPCWQLTNGYGASIGPERTPAIGCLAWWPKQNRIERWLYPVQQTYEPITFKATYTR